MKYNHLFESHFSGCLHIAGYHDPHRRREVKVYLVPGDHSVVGISDGVDAWVAPVNSSIAGCDLGAILQSVRDKTFQGPNPVKTPRKMIRLESAAQPGPATAVPQAETRIRRRGFTNV